MTAEQRVAHYSHTILGIRGKDGSWVFVNPQGRPTRHQSEAKAFGSVEAIDIVMRNQMAGIPAGHRAVAITMWTDGTSSLDFSAGRPHLPRCRTPFCPICMGELPYEADETKPGGR